MAAVMLVVSVERRIGMRAGVAGAQSSGEVEQGVVMGEVKVVHGG